MTFLPPKRFFPVLAVALLSAVLLVCAIPATAQIPRTSETPLGCGKGLALQVSAPRPLQGSLLRAVLRSAAPLSEVEGEWAGHKVSFWRDDAQGKVHRAFVGVDLELAAGRYEFTAAARNAGGERVMCTTTVTVRAGRFAVERLTVAPQFVQPSPEDLERAKKEGERLHWIFVGREPERLWNGAFRFPLDGPRGGGNFGRRRILNGEPRSPHGGLDVPALTGTAVHAAQRGRVVLAAAFYFSGNTVVVDHGLGVYTFYGHLSEIGVKEGDLVDPGALIGRVGATGRVTGSHLHWGLIVNEAKVNPLQILPQELPKK